MRLVCCARPDEMEKAQNKKIRQTNLRSAVNRNCIAQHQIFVTVEWQVDGICRRREHWTRTCKKKNNNNSNAKSNSIINSFISEIIIYDGWMLRLTKMSTFVTLTTEWQCDREILN